MFLVLNSCFALLKNVIVICFVPTMIIKNKLKKFNWKAIFWHLRKQIWVNAYILHRPYILH